MSAANKPNVASRLGELRRGGFAGFVGQIQKAQRRYARSIRRKAARHLTPEKNQKLLEEAQRLITFEVVR